MGFNIHTLPKEHVGYRIFKDGDAWCAVGPEFVDPAASVSGWGDSPTEAYIDWCRRSLLDHERRDQLLPLFADFQIEISRVNQKK
jgi:hypothetical protein